MNRVQVVLSGFSVRLFCFVQDHGRSAHVGVLQNNELKVGYPSYGLSLHLVGISSQVVY